MQVNDYAECNFSILNTGKFNFIFSWEFCNAKKFRQYFALSPESGTVEAGERVETMVSFHPLKAFTLKDIELKLQVGTQGPCFPKGFHCTRTARKPWMSSTSSRQGRRKEV